MIGVGLMGHGIAANLLKHGHALSFHHHSGNQPVDDLVAAGAKGMASAADVATASDIVILCVTGSPAVEDAVLRADGVLRGLKPGAVVIDCTTAMPSSTVKIAKAVEAAGARYMDAAMTRTPKEAAEGRLGLIVGGDAALLREVEPVLRCYADSIVHAGPVGSGHKAKLLHNFVSLGFAAILAEATACAGRAGIGAGAFLEVLGKGAGDGVVFRRFKPYIEAGDVSGLRFSIANALKDMSYYVGMAGDVSAQRGIAEAIRQTYADAAQKGHASSFVPELIGMLARRDEP
jgi:3-hydroxyisobutyrate dehydrogenase